MDPRLRDELARIDAAAAALPELTPPPELADRVLAEIAAAPVPMATPLLPPAQPGAAAPPSSPANRPFRRLGAVAAAAAAVLVAVLAWPTRPEVGDPADFVARGSEEVRPTVDLRMAVQDSAGGVDRHHAGEAYDAGDTLLFRYETRPGTHLHLVRVDARSARLLHVEQAAASTGDLLTEGAPLGYELERGEEAAVYALVSSNTPIGADRIEATLGAQPGRADALGTTTICDTARHAGWGCAAVRVEAVR